MTRLKRVGRFVLPVLAATAAGAAFAPAAEAKLITFTYTGTIKAGAIDPAGLWGAPNSNLAGRTIKVVHNVDTSLGTYVSYFQSQTSTEYRWGDATTPGPVLSSSVTIGSSTVSWVPNYFNRVIAEQIAPNLVGTWPNGWSDMSQSSDSYSSGEWTELFTLLVMSNASLPFGIDALGSAVIDPADLIGTNGYTRGWHYDVANGPKVYDWNIPFDFTSYSVKAASVAPIPEPPSWTLLVAALGIAALVFGFSLRRKAKV